MHRQVVNEALLDLALWPDGPLLIKALVQAHRKLQQALGRPLPIVTLLQHPTVRGLARQLAGNGDSRLAAQAVNERARRQQEAMARMKAVRKG